MIAIELILSHSLFCLARTIKLYGWIPNNQRIPTLYNIMSRLYKYHRIRRNSRCHNIRPKITKKIVSRLSPYFLLDALSKLPILSICLTPVLESHVTNSAHLPGIESTSPVQQTAICQFIQLWWSSSKILCPSLRKKLIMSALRKMRLKAVIYFLKLIFLTSNKNQP